MDNWQGQTDISALINTWGRVVTSEDAFAERITIGPTTYQICHLWANMETGNTIYLATEDGLPAGNPNETCRDFANYREDPVKALLISLGRVPDHVASITPYTVFETLLCPRCRLFRLQCEPARLSLSTITAILALVHS